MKSLLERLNVGSGAAMSLLRVVSGVLLAWHGYRKFDDGLEGLEGFLTFLDLPAPAALAFIVAALELVGGILLALGLLTRPISLLFVIHFGLIFLWVKLNKLDSVFLVGGEDPGVELDLLYLSVAAFFLTAGPGPFSVDRMVGIEGAASEEGERQLTASMT